MSTNARVLRWLEMSLLAVGIALAAWCAVVLVEAHYYRALPDWPGGAAAGRPRPARAGAYPRR